MYFLYTWRIREWCNLFGSTPNSRDSRINHMFRNTFPMCDNWIIPLSLGDQVKVYTSALVCTSCTRGVQENGALCLVVHQTAEILGLIICFAIISYAWKLNNTPKTRRPGVRCTTSALVCTSCTRGVQENGALCLFVPQTAEILGLIICFAILFLCVTIE